MGRVFLRQPQPQRGVAAADIHFYRSKNVYFRLNISLRHFFDQAGQLSPEERIQGLLRVGEIEAGLELVTVAQPELDWSEDQGQENRRCIASVDQALFLELLYLPRQRRGQTGFLVSQLGAPIQRSPLRSSSGASCKPAARLYPGSAYRA